MGVAIVVDDNLDRGKFALQVAFEHRDQAAKLGAGPPRRASRPFGDRRREQEPGDAADLLLRAENDGVHRTILT
jgi:hypothetical protein